VITRLVRRNDGSFRRGKDMKKVVFFLLLIFFYAHILYAQDITQQTAENARLHEYSLGDLFSLALERAEEIKISAEDLYIALRGKDKAISALLPTLSAFGDYRRYSERKMSSSGFAIQPDSTSSWGLRADQSISLGGREFISYKIAKHSIAKGKLDLRAVKEEYLLAVAAAYYDLLKSKKAYEIAAADVERLTKHRDAARIRLQVGEATKTVLLRAQAELAHSNSELIRAENGLRLAKSVLARTVGINRDYDIKESELTLDPVFETVGCQLPHLECLKERSIAERDDLRSSAVQKKIAQKRIEYAKGSYWPTLSLEGIYVRTKNEPSASFEITERVYGGLRLDFPFFEGGLRRAEVSEAEAKQRQSELDYNNLLKSVEIEVEDAYLDFVTQKSILKSFQEQLVYAQDNYHLVSKQFDFGLADSIDVMDANTLLVTAERELSNAEYDYQLAVIKVRRATGTLLKTVTK
jgi:outer membrane protein